MKSIGIYFGENYYSVAYMDKSVQIIATGPNNEELCRSCVAVDRDGRFYVGNIPYRNWRRYAPNIVVSVRNLMGASSKDTMVQKMMADKDGYPFNIATKSGDSGESIVVILNGKEYTPEQICAVILRQLLKDVSIKLGEEITHAVMTVPTYFNEKQLIATRRAAKLSGLKVQQLISESVAAAISYSTDIMEFSEHKKYLVYEINDNRLDLSILEITNGVFETVRTYGDIWLGGDALDKLIYDYVICEAGKTNNVDIQKLIDRLSDRKRYSLWGTFKNELECAKNSLFKSESATISIYDELEDEEGEPIDIEVTLTYETFKGMNLHKIQYTLDLIDEFLKKSTFSIDAIEKILLAGCLSNIPFIREMLSDRFGKDKIVYSEKPILAIAKGAAILSHSLSFRTDCSGCKQSLRERELLSSQDIDFIRQIEESENRKDNHTTKHKIYLQSLYDTEDSYQLIVDVNEILPFKRLLKFNLQTSGVSIIKMELYSDGENDSIEKLCNVYLLTEKGFPKNSNLQIVLILDKNESLSIQASFSDIKKPVAVVMGRGDYAGFCCDNLHNKFQEVLSGKTIEKLLQRKQLRKIADSIASYVPNYDDRRWYIYNEQILNIFR